MGDVINLRQARKARKRGAASASADANRAKFGQTAAEKDRLRAETERATRLLDGARRDPEP